jgi:hypothetical protein
VTGAQWVSRRTLSLLLATSSALAAHAAEAAPSCTTGDRSCGSSAFAAGTQAFDRGAFAEAAEWFQAAQSAAAHPVVAFNLGVCYARLNQPTLATREFRKILAEPGLDAALKARVEREQRAAEAQIARISVDAPDPTLYAMELDGKPLAAPPDGVEVDPGAHRLKVYSGGTSVFDQEVRLEAGERLRLRVTGKASVIDVVVVPGNAPQSAAPAERHEQPAENRKPLAPVVFYVSASATALLGAATIWSGLDVKSAYSDYLHDLPELTQVEADERVRDGHAREVRTNVLLGTTLFAAGATALLGLVWVDWSPKEKPTAGARLTLGLGPASASVRWVF